VQAATDSATAALRKQLDEARAKRDELLDKLTQRLATAAGIEQPEPSPVVTEADAYNVTAKMSKRLAAFDGMSDGDQVDSLKAMWA